MGSADVRFGGEVGGGFPGFSISSAGDFNDDGLDDLLIGAHAASGNQALYAGKTYLVYGRTGGSQMSGDFALGSADVIFLGQNQDDNAGFSVAAGGDINGDGIDDVLIGARTADRLNRNQVGAASVVFGRSGTTQLTGSFNLLAANRNFLGIDVMDHAGEVVASAGDVDGDGFDDLLIAAPDGDPHSASFAGETYLVYGQLQSTSTRTTASLTTASAIFEGIDQLESSGNSISSAGDFNGDGLDDLLIGARLASPDGKFVAGRTYLIYGRAGVDRLSGVHSLADADVTFTGIVDTDHAGVSVAGAGDVNGDGIDDILIGADGAHPISNSFGSGPTGEVYLIYGRSGANALAGSYDLSLADVVFRGIGPGSDTGASVAAAGDVNGDGLSDILIGAPRDSPHNSLQAGRSFLIYGRRDVPEPASLLLSLFASAFLPLRRRSIRR